MDTVTDIKIMLAKKQMKMTELVKELGIRLNKKYTLSNFSQKLHANNLKHSEIKIIADILGHEIIFKEKKD